MHTQALERSPHVTFGGLKHTPVPLSGSNSPMKFGRQQGSQRGISNSVVAGTRSQREGKWLGANGSVRARKMALRPEVTLRGPAGYGVSSGTYIDS
jgi:hypothetical protein